MTGLGKAVLETRTEPVPDVQRRAAEPFDSDARWTLGRIDIDPPNPLPFAVAKFDTHVENRIACRGFR